MGRRLNHQRTVIDHKGAFEYGKRGVGTAGIDDCDSLSIGVEPTLYLLCGDAFAVVELACFDAGSLQDFAIAKQEPANSEGQQGVRGHAQQEYPEHECPQSLPAPNGTDRKDAWVLDPDLTPPIVWFVKYHAPRHVSRPSKSIGPLDGAGRRVGIHAIERTRRVIRTQNPTRFSPAKLRRLENAVSNHR